jgi:TolB protein
MALVGHKYIKWILLVILLSLAKAGFGAEVYLNVTKSGRGKIGIAIDDFIPQDNSPADDTLSPKIRKIISNDLKMSGLFDPVENHLFIKEASERDKKEGRIVFQEWSLLGAQALVKGSYSSTNSSSLTMGFKLYEVTSGKLLVEKKYQGQFQSFRQMAHKISDEIIYQFTGEKGITQTKIAFVSGEDGVKELYYMDYDGHNPRRLTRNKSLSLSPAWSADGQKIIFTLYKKLNPNIYLIDFTNWTQSPLTTYRGLNTSPAWSPLGDRIALVLSKDGNPEIYTMNPDGSNIQRLTNYPGIDTCPSWSPNGREIIFTSDRSGSPQLYVMDAEGANFRRLTFEGSYNDLAAWSPKGDKIAYCSQIKGKFQIFIMNANGTEPQQLTFLGGSNENPTWSPDGRRLAFSSTAKGVPQIFSINIDGTELRQLTFLQGGGFEPAWSPWIE